MAQKPQIDPDKWMSYDEKTMIYELYSVRVPECDISTAAAERQDFVPCPAGSFSKTDMADETGT